VSLRFVNDTAAQAALYVYAGGPTRGDVPPEYHTTQWLRAGESAEARSAMSWPVGVPLRVVVRGVVEGHPAYTAEASVTPSSAGLLCLIRATEDAEHIARVSVTCSRP
jgi:hypothetical protein